MLDKTGAHTSIISHRKRVLTTDTWMSHTLSQTVETAPGMTMDTSWEDTLPKIGQVQQDMLSKKPDENTWLRCS